MAWNETTNFRHAGFRGIAAFRVAGNLGCTLLVKPWFLIVGLGFERWEGGCGIYVGPLAIGFGPIDQNEEAST